MEGGSVGEAERHGGSRRVWARGAEGDVRLTAGVSTAVPPGLGCSRREAVGAASFSPPRGGECPVLGSRLRVGCWFCCGFATVLSALGQRIPSLALF